jgi:hypothetical protein
VNRAGPDPLRARWHAVEIAVRDSRFYRGLAAETRPSFLRRAAQWLGVSPPDADRAAFLARAAELESLAEGLRADYARELLAIRTPLRG